MPELCRFYGIIIRMHMPDHEPPHFHALYSGQEALVEIDRLSIMRGRLPPRAFRLVTEWASLHRDELMANWDRVRRSEPLDKIAPLE